MPHQNDEFPEFHQDDVGSSIFTHRIQRLPHFEILIKKPSIFQMFAMTEIVIIKCRKITTASDRLYEILMTMGI